MTADASTAGRDREARELRAVVIGGSAGGIDALRALLPALPRATRVPVLVVLHIAPETKGDRWPLVFPGCELEIREAEDKDRAEAGNVYIAPADYHLLVDSAGTLSLSTEPRVNLSRPSIDVLFESAAWAYGRGALGIVLSGANADGAHGLVEIDRLGGLCWVQCPEQASAPPMPRAALQAVPGARVMSLEQMVEEFRGIVEWTR